MDAEDSQEKEATRPAGRSQAKLACAPGVYRL